MYEGFLVEPGPQGVERVILARPERFNALTLTMVDGLAEYFGGLTRRPEVRLVELSAQGANFCVGLDLKLPCEALSEGPAFGVRYMERYGEIVLNMRRAPQPIVAVVRGAASGGGLCMAIGADLRIADTSAKFNTAFIKLGLSGCELGVSYLLPPLVGAGIAADMVLTGRTVAAEEALHIGLISRLARPEELSGTAAQVSAAILESGDFGLRVTKEALWNGLACSSLQQAIAFEARNQALAFQSGDVAAGVDAFRGKRKPAFAAKKWC